MTKRTHSFVWGGIAAAICLIIGIASGSIGFWLMLGITSFTLASCLILDNNFVGEMIIEIFSWGFVKMPGLIFELDLDGIIWMLTVKLLFWILGLLLALLFGIFAIALGLFVSLFVYPFALYNDIKNPEAV